MNKLAILFRLDVGSDIGMGHWIRCLALCDALHTYNPEIKPVWLINPLKDNLRVELLNRNIEFYEGDWTNSESIFFVAKKVGAKILILDMMNVGVRWVKEINHKLYIISVGGSGEGRDHVGVSINGMIPRKGFLDNFAGEHLYVGPEYIILRKEFEVMQKHIPPARINNVYVSLGGDAYGLGLEIAKCLSSLRPNWNVEVVLGSYANLKKQNFSGMIKCHYNVSNPAKIMSRCDLAITAGGMTTFELLFLGVPTIIIPLNNNQNDPAKAFDKANVAINMGLWRNNDNIFVKRLKEVLNRIESLSLRREMSVKSREVIDGNGIERICKIIEETVKKILINKITS